MRDPCPTLEQGSGDLRQPGACMKVPTTFNSSNGAFVRRMNEHEFFDAVEFDRKGIPAPLNARVDLRWVTVQGGTSYAPNKLPKDEELKWHEVYSY